MISFFKRLSHNEYAFTIIARIVSFSLGLVYSILFSRYLQPELRGEVSVVLNYSSFLMLFLCFGINQGYPFFRREKPDVAYKEYVDLIAAFFVLYLSLSVLFIIVIHTEPEWRYTSILIPFLFAIKELNYAVMIEKPYIRNWASIILSLFDIVFILTFYFFIKANYTIAMMFIIIKEIVYFVVAVIQSGINIRKIRPSLRNAKKYVKYGFIPMITIILMDINYRIDVIMLDSFHIIKANIGIYTLAVSLAEKIWLIPDAMKDMLVSRLAKGSNEKEVSRVTRVSIALVIVLSLFLVIIGRPLINSFYGVEYKNAYDVIVFLLVGIVGMVFYKTVYSYNVTRGKRIANLLFLGIAAIANIIANWILIPKYHIYGAAIASSISYFICGIAFLTYFCVVTHTNIRKMTIIQVEDFTNIKKIIGRVT